MFVIIGQGAAGTAAAREIKRLSPTTEVLMLTDETYYYYSRIDLPEIVNDHRPLEKCILCGEKGFADLGVKTIPGAVVASIDRGKKEVILEDGRSFPYEKLLLATGSRNAFPLEKAENMKGVYSLWTLQDAFDIREAAKDAKNVIVVGGGFIGIKTALALNKLGLKVSIAAGRQKRLMRSQLDEHGSEIMRQALEAKGITVLTGGGVDDFLEENGAVRGIRIGADEFLCDFAVVATGTHANTSLAESAGLEVNRGIIVNEYMQTSDENIYSAGNCAEMEDITGKHIVSATWGSAVDTGRIAGRNMLGKNSVCDRYLKMNSVEIAGIPIVSAGEIVADENDEVVIDEKNGCYQKTIYSDGLLKGILRMGNIKDTGVWINMLRQKNVPVENNPSVKTGNYIDLHAL